jgi:hypothetical protein
MLSTAQRREFHRNGFLVIESGIDGSTVSAAREAVWELIDEHPEDPSTWPHENRGERAEDCATSDPFRAINDVLFDYCEAMVGEGLLTGENRGVDAQLALRFPREETVMDPDAPQIGAIGGHVDGTLDVEDGAGDVVPHTINGVAYLDRVQPYGGGFTAWPGSHRTVCEYVDEHPIQSIAGGIPAPDGQGGWRETPLDEVYDPFEITGDAGTVVLWHGRLQHTGGINLRPGSLRIAHIQRFFHTHAHQYQEDAPEEPYLGWAGMDGIVTDDGYEI